MMTKLIYIAAKLNAHVPDALISEISDSLGRYPSLAHKLTSGRISEILLVASQ